MNAEKGAAYCKFVSDYAEHVYDSETGTECVTCGYTRTICGHTYSEGFNSWDETSHWRECTNPVCTDRSGSQKDKAAHTFNSYGDCTVCGYRHTEHAYGEWHYDGSEHWKTCTKPGCQAQTGKSGHTYSGDICSVCGYDRSITPAHTHFYGEWSRDSREHWRECTDPNCPEENGRIINRDAHVYDDDADTTCNVCKYERSAAPDHSGGHVYGDWSWDINSHWHECTDADCTDKTGSIKDKAAHSYDDDTDPYCNDCGYVRSTKFSHTVYLFSGILICGCCGSRMTRKTNRANGKEYHYYYCPTGKKKGCVHPVMLKESSLIDCVRDSLKAYIGNIASLKALLSGIDQSSINQALAKEYSDHITDNERRLEQVLEFKARLYESLVGGMLTKEEYASYKAKYTKQAEDIRESVRVLKEKLTEVLENRSERNRWISQFTQFSTLETLDRRALIHMVQSIRVRGKKELDITFTHEDEYKKALQLLALAVQQKDYEQRKVG